jgi:hypothetical protein
MIDRALLHEEARGVVEPVRLNLTCEQRQQQCLSRRRAWPSIGATPQVTAQLGLLLISILSEPVADEDVAPRKIDFHQRRNDAYGPRGCRKIAHLSATQAYQNHGNLLV